MKNDVDIVRSSLPEISYFPVINWLMHLALFYKVFSSYILKNNVKVYTWNSFSSKWMVSSTFSSSSDYIKNVSGRGKNTRVLMSETMLNATRTILMGSFMKNVKKDDFIFNFLSKLGCCSQEYKSRKIHRNLVNPEVIIAPTKTGKTKFL